jgi:hypothetical protein
MAELGDGIGGIDGHHDDTGAKPAEIAADEVHAAGQLHRQAIAGCEASPSQSGGQRRCALVERTPAPAPGIVDQADVIRRLHGRPAQQIRDGAFGLRRHPHASPAARNQAIEGSRPAAVTTAQMVTGPMNTLLGTSSMRRRLGPVASHRNRQLAQNPAADTAHCAS